MRATSAELDPAMDLGITHPAVVLGDEVARRGIGPEHVLVVRVNLTALCGAAG